MRKISSYVGRDFFARGAMLTVSLKLKNTIIRKENLICVTNVKKKKIMEKH